MDNLKKLKATMTSSAEDAFLITPSDSVDVRETTKSLLLGAAGDLQVTMKGMALGTSIILPCPAGYNPLRVTRVWVTNTTATGIAGLV